MLPPRGPFLSWTQRMCNLQKDITLKHGDRNEKYIIIWRYSTRPGKNTRVPGYPPGDTGIRVGIHLAGYPNPNKNREVLQVWYVSRCFPWFLHQIMMNKQNNDKQISEKLGFSVCKLWFGYISLSDMWEFPQILVFGTKIFDFCACL